ncbi:MAG: aspartate aminotransferase family protein [Myxococcaceae bacterium]|nr:aspartate aminotransferase family protein [Myxococcaceae bacterium]
MRLPKRAEAVLSYVPPSVAKGVESALEKIPGVGAMVRAEKAKVAESLKAQVRKHRPAELATHVLPKKGFEKTELLAVLEKLSKGEEKTWKDGRVSGGVYHGDAEHLRFLDRVYSLYSQANPLHADVWPSVVRFEAEIVSMTAKLLGAPEMPLDSEHAVCGTLSSGGTESIMLAIKAYRDHARRYRRIEKGNIVLPSSAHPAFDKAAHTLDLEARRVPVAKDGRADVVKMKRALDKRTLVMIGSAPGFPHGLIDPIEELSELARSRKAGFHTDCCLGGFVLPFARELGYPVPRFDFALPGVTSISADTHKFGYAAKGTSVVLYRGHALRKAQYFATPDWPGGLYVTPGFAGSRPGALVASAWATMMATGHDGYLQSTKAVLEAAAKLRDGIRQIPELEVIGDPLWVIAFRSDKLDVYRVLDEMAKKGWSLNGLQKPAAVHVCVTLRHTQPGVVDALLTDLKSAVEAVRGTPPAKDGMAPVYGLASSLPFKGLVSDLLSAYVDALYDA